MNGFDESIIGVMAPVFLALVLVAAAIPKFRKADEFVGIIANYRLLPDAWVTPFARVLPMIEVLCAVGLMVPVLRTGAGWMAAGLFMLFALALGINIGRGRTHIDCGCVRRPTSRSRIGMFHVLRALALAGVALYVAVVPLSLPSVSIASGALGFAAAGMLVLMYMSADLLIGLPKSIKESSIKELPINHGRGT